MPQCLNAQEIQGCLITINKIPTSEIKYYLLLALHSIRNADAAEYRDFLNELNNLSNKLTHFLLPENTTFSSTVLKDIYQSYQKLCEFSKANTATIAVGDVLINLGATLLAILGGVLGGITGSVVGLGRSVWELGNPLSYLKDGAITGFAFGAAIGFRAPKKIFKNELTRQLKFCLNQLEHCLQEMQEQKIKPLSYYKDKVKNRLLKECFNNDEKAYEEFLDEDKKFQIVTLRAQFVSEQLEGYLGHHACIVLSLPNQQEPELIEFSLGKSDLRRKFTQKEERIVTGEKIVEMMAFHQLLQETQACSLQYILTKMKAGENDCFRYIEKILLCTGQKTIELKRFDDSENWVGRNIVGFFVKKLSPFKQNIFEEEPDQLASSTNQRN
ncbi:hypothetical protein [Legionella bozemanae]|uniref:hypothetical protein n=1 Tax=Legionella bozemanae TaxID=447 RepID=UPI001040EC24|nr:hypothetical protein [Legionella bozemanae]